MFFIQTSMNATALENMNARKDASTFQAATCARVTEDLYQVIRRVKPVKVSCMQNSFIYCYY